MNLYHHGVDVTYLRDSSEAAIRVHTKPQHGQDSPGDDSKISEIIPKAGSNCYGEWDTVIRTGSSTQDCSQG